MAMNAAEMADLIFEKKVRATQKSFERLKDKVTATTAKMIADMEGQGELDLTDEDMLALTDVTEAMRALGYKFRFVEVQNEKGELVRNKLTISIAHLLK